MPPHDTQGMSPAELELLNEIDDDGVPKESPDEVANREALARPNTDEGDGGDPAEAPAAAPAPAPAPAPAAPAAAPAAAAPAAEPGAEEGAETPPSADIPAAPAPLLPTFKAEVPADAQAQIEALTLEAANAFDKLMDGDITKEEYRAIQTRVDASVDELKTKALTASIFDQVNQQTAMQAAENEWKRNEASIFATAKSEGFDYGKPALLAALNHHLKALGNDPANENRDAAWFLTEAHKRTKTDLVGAAPAQSPAPSPSPAPAPTPRVDMSKIPPTLGRVPPAAEPSITGDEFAHLGNLKGDELERAVARMSPEQQERWLN